MITLLTFLFLLHGMHICPPVSAAPLHQVFLYDSYSTNTLQLSNPILDSLSPDLNAMGHVAWEANDGNDWEIFLYQGGFPITQITNNTLDDEIVRININDFLSWQRNDGNDKEIVLYDGGATTVVTNNDMDDEEHQLNDNGIVVWMAHDGTDQEIYYYDGTLHQLTNNGYAYDDSDPQINVYGHITWQGWMGASPMVPQEIFLFNGTTTTRLTNNLESDIIPQIGDGGYVAWEHTGVPDSHIFLYDGASVTQISTTNNNSYPEINAGGSVTWMGHDGTDSEIFLYQGGAVHQITNNSYDDWFPVINDNGHLAWMGKNSADWEIFYYNGTTATAITTNTYDDWYPKIVNADDSGAYIAWHATVKPCGTLPLPHGSTAGSQIFVLLLLAAPLLGWLQLQKRKVRVALRAHT